MESILLLTEQDVQDWLEFAYSYPNPTIAFDLETNSAEEAIAKVYGIGIAFDANQAFYIPYRTKAGELWWKDKSEELIDYISTILAKSKIMGHNVLYDTLVWKNNFNQDIRQNILADTILMKHMLDEERPHGLKDTAVKYLGPWADKAQQELQESVLANGGRWVAAQKDMYLADTEILGTYCCWDVLLTYKLYELFSPEIDKQGLRDLFEQEVMPLYKEVTIGMKEEGVTLDLPMFREKKDKVIKVIDNLENEIMQDIQPLTEEFVNTWLNDEFPIKQSGNFPKAYAQVVGIELNSTAKKVIKALTPVNEVQENFKYWMLDECYDLEGPIRDAQMLMFHNKHPDKKYVFNLGSKHHLKWLFFDKLKETPLSFTEKKEPQVDDAFLASIADRYPWVVKIQQLNVLNKTLGTYYEGMLERQVDGKLYTSFLQFGTTSGRFASSNPNLQNLSAPQKTGDITDEFVNSIRQGFIAKPGYMLIGSDFCLHPKTKILTKDRGWLPILDVEVEDQVWQINSDTLAGSWVHPIRTIKRNYNGKMYTFGNRRGNFSVTENHTMLWVGQQNHPTRKDKAKYRNISLSQEGIPTWGCHVLTGSAASNTVSTYSDEEIWKACALQADGSKSRTKDTYNIEVSIERKRNKLNSLFGPGKLSDHTRECHTLPTERWRVNFSSELLDWETKTLKLESLGGNQVDTFVAALKMWDASTLYGEAFQYFSTIKENAEQVQRYLVRNGYEAKITITLPKQEQHSICYNVTIRPLKGVRLRPDFDVTENNYSGEVGCVTVPDGFILIESEGQTFVTGNCALEPNIAAFVSGDPGLIDIFVQDKDFYSAIAIKQFKLDNLSPFKEDENYLGNKDKALRNRTKCYSLATFYGAEGPRISQVLGCSIEEADDLVEGYLNAFPGIRKFIERSHYDATRKGFVKTIFGRVRHLKEVKELYERYGPRLSDWKWARSNRLLEERKIYKNLLNNAVNFQIQGTAGHVMNRAMLKTKRLLEEKGIVGKPIMQIHDEQIVQVRADQVEAAAEIVKFAMETAVELNPIKLKATPIIGRSYGDCK